MEEAEGMKDVSSTSFGLLIAFLLPGFAGVFALSFWSPPIADLFSAFIEGESNVGRFLLVILCSLVVGLEVSVCRWLLFEKFLCRNHKRNAPKYRHLSDQNKLMAFRAAVDENYRYHQFWGGMAIVTPFIGWGLVQRASEIQRCPLFFAFLVLEALNFAGGWSAYRNYIDRTNRILEESEYGERMGTTRAGIGRDEAHTSAAAPAPAAAPAAPSAAPSSEAISDDKSCDVTGAQTPP